MVVVGEQNLVNVVPYEGDGEAYQTPFGNNDDGDGICINLVTLSNSLVTTKVSLFYIPHQAPLWWMQGL